MAKVEDAFSIYWQAYNFEVATKLIASNIMKKPFLLFPYMVNCSFSVELYIKCIYHIESNGSLLAGHNLLALFKQIGPDYQGKIELNWNKHINKNIERILDMNKPGFPPALTALEDVLRVSGDAFINARYFYEQKNLGDFMIDSLPICIRLVIDENFPSWKARADPVIETL